MHAIILGDLGKSSFLTEPFFLCSLVSLLRRCWIYGSTSPNLRTKVDAGYRVAVSSRTLPTMNLSFLILDSLLLFDVSVCTVERARSERPQRCSDDH